jgi:enoyl-CoA hydratase
MSTLVTLEHPTPHIAVLTLQRAERLNALNRALISDLRDQLRALQPSTDIRCMLLRGSGEKAFAAGADIAEMQSLNETQAREFSAMGHETFDMLARMAFPTIAVVHGFALGGGCELALACDFIVAAENAKFGQPEVKLGLIPGFGATHRLPRRVGLAHALQLICSGATIDAQQAQRIGLVNQCWPADELWNQALALAQQIAQMAPRAVRAAKHIMQQTLHLSADVPVHNANELERDAFANCFTTQDARDGIDAFLKKTQAHFHDR